MKCPKCGANLGLEDKYCPYCGNANPFAKQHQAEMQHYKSEFEKTQALVEKRANRFARFAVPLTILGIALILLAVSVVFNAASGDIGRKLRASKLTSQSEALRTQIDNALDNGDYSLVSILYHEQDLYLLSSSGEEKLPLSDYEMIFRACSSYENAADILADLPGRSGFRFSPEHISDTCEFLAEDLVKIYTIDKDSWYSEGSYAPEKLEHLHALQDQTSALLLTYAGFTKEEVRKIPDLSEAKLREMLEERLCKR